MNVQYSLFTLLGLFLIYSFLGWCMEVCFIAVTKGQVVNRGFLNGPVCPIYGVGMIGVLVLLTPISDSVPMLFFGGMVLCSAVELAGGWLLEKVFDTRWWDYSGKPFNLGGYICLSFSLMWGMAVTFAVRLIHPAILSLVEHVPHTLGIVLLWVLYALFLADLTVTLITIVGIKRRLRELDRVAETLHALGDSLSGRLGSTALAADARLDSLKESGQEKMAEGREKVASAVSAGQEKMAESREKLQQKVSGTRAEIQERRRELEEKQKRLLQEYRSRFSVRRLSDAFPDIRETLRKYTGNIDKE